MENSHTPTSEELKGVVVFFEADYETTTIKEIGRTKDLPYWLALEYYAETPNPASQIYSFTTQEEHIAAEKELQDNINNFDWLMDLFDCI